MASRIANPKEVPTPPDASGGFSFVAVLGNGCVSMSIWGFDAMPDDDLGCGCDLWFSDNDNEAPYAWRERCPTYD